MRFWSSTAGQVAALYALAAVALALMIVIIWDTVTHDPRPPIASWNGVQALNSPIHPGDELHVRIERDKIRDDCPVSSTRTAIDTDGRAWPLEPGAWKGGSADLDAIEFSYATPAVLPPGEYLLRVHLVYHCPEFSWATQQPDTPFRVVAP